MGYKLPRGIGKKQSQVYRAWYNMKTRCNNPKIKNYDLYGGRGITYQTDWESFDAFYRDMGEPPGPGYSLERKNGDLGYTIHNCVWATQKEQLDNRSVTMWVTINDERMTLSDACRMVSVPLTTIHSRMRRKQISAEEALYANFC